MKTNFLNERQLDLLAMDTGYITEANQLDFKIVKINDLRLRWLIGLGYWKDTFAMPYEGYVHVYILPFMSLRIGKFKMPQK